MPSYSAIAASGGSVRPAASPAHGTLDRRLCQVVGLNQNYKSRTRTPYHIQIEDRGPIGDGSGRQVRRVNIIIYTNYGEPNARIIFGRNHDFEDIRTQEHNRFVARRISELATEALVIVEDHEERQLERIKGLVREYSRTGATATKRELADANAGFPLLFARAWGELKKERAAAAPSEGPAPDLYSLDAILDEQVLEIERVVILLTEDLERLAAQGSADDILVQTCRRLVTRARACIANRTASAFTSRRMDMTRNSLLKTWTLVRSRLSGNARGL
jgi:hypothetical protein